MAKTRVYHYESKRQFIEWKHTDSPVKKKCRAQWLINIMLTVFWDMKRIVIIDFLEKGATINSDSFCQLLQQNSSYLSNDHCIDCSSQNPFGVNIYVYKHLCMCVRACLGLCTVCVRTPPTSVRDMARGGSHWQGHIMCQIELFHI